MIREEFQLGIAALQKRKPSVDEDGNSIFKIDVHCPPDPDDVIDNEDILILFGQDQIIQKFTKT